jgi:hypothetical protein
MRQNFFGLATDFRLQRRGVSDTIRAIDGLDVMNGCGFGKSLNVKTSDHIQVTQNL